MAHNLATIDGEIAMAYDDATPWHRMGKRITGDVATNLARALQVARLDYTVTLEPLFVGDGRPVPNRRVIVREGDDRPILGTVSGWYKPIQNIDAFAPFESAMREFGLSVASAGALGQGEKAWVLFRLPDSASVEPVGGDHINGYGLAVTSHDGKGSCEFLPTPIRVVCQNTLTLALGAGGERGRIYSIAHIGNVKRQLDAVEQMITHTLAAMKKAGDTFARMAARRMTPAEVAAFVEDVFPARADGTLTPEQARRRATVGHLVWEGVGADMAGSNAYGTTAWAAYNAVTEYFDHVAPALASAERQTRVATSAVFGAGATVKMRAFAAARELVAA